MVQANNDGDILELPRQLDGLGGGAHKCSYSDRVDFADISSIKSLMAAWAKFARGKKSRADVAEYQKHLRRNVRELHAALRTGCYRHGTYRQFTICDPKTRRIHKAAVQDRLVHQAVVSAIEPLFEKRFIHDSYSCRQSKGTHAGRKRLAEFLGRESCNNTRKVYVLKCDIKQFFALIDHELLMERLAVWLDDVRVLELLRDILLSHGAEVGRGIPLGNVTSQLFANIYLHELDWFMKQTLGVRRYIRYCDDFVVVSHDKQYLESLIEPIRIFLGIVLKLELHPHKVTVCSWEQGIDFLGFVFRPHAITLRTKTKRRMVARVTQRNLSSYMGICAHADAYRLGQVAQLVAWQRELLS